MITITSYQLFICIMIFLCGVVAGMFIGRAKSFDEKDKYDVEDISMAFGTWLNDKGIFFNGNPERNKSIQDLYLEFKIEKGF